jgi:hypothetical protein
MAQGKRLISIHKRNDGMPSVRQAALPVVSPVWRFTIPRTRLSGPLHIVMGDDLQICSLCCKTKEAL